MFCPKCSAYITEKDFVRQNPRAAGGITVEYDARCPQCRIMLGHVVWGKLTPEPGLDIGPEPEWKLAGAESLQLRPAAAELGEAEESVEPGQEQDAAGDKIDIPDLPLPKRCPHCGGELPHDF